MRSGSRAGCGAGTASDPSLSGEGATAIVAASVMEFCDPAAFMPLPIMQMPRAHMTAQGRIESRIGATPMATSHGQLSAAPPIASAEAPRMTPHRPCSHVGKQALQRELLVPAAPWRHGCAESGFRCDPVLLIVSICVALSPAAGWTIEAHP